MIILYVFLCAVGAIIALTALHALFLCVLALAVRKEDYEKASGFYRAVFYYYVKVAMFFCRLKIKTSGKEKLAAIKGDFLVVANHRSDFDPFAMLLGLNIKDLAFISKPENFRVPIFGKIVKKCLYLPIDRENAKNAIKTINKAAEFIASGAATFCVYPEGTRSKCDKMLPFHDGVFKIAQKADSAVAVVAVRGTERVRSRAPFRPTEIYLDVVDVIDSETVKTLSSHELSDRARSALILATDGK